MKLRVSLSDVDSRRGACGKPNCSTGSHRLNRHHKGHEYLFVSFWIGRYFGEDWYKEFVARYHRFEPEDIIYICTPHHAEIHQIYDKIIARDVAERKIPLPLYSRWTGEELMEKLREACVKWLEEETPGIDPDKFDTDRAFKTKKKRRKKKKRKR